MTRGCFVTGTDTEIGKTLVSTGLLHALRQQGLSALGMKPVAAGTTLKNGQLANDDVNAIIAASSKKVDRALVNPYLFNPPIAPHIAAAEANVAIDAAHIVECFGKLAAMADVVVVEGVGGFRVPLSEHADTADLACALALPVILVVGLRLGCINHALLTAEAIRARGLHCIGWVANQVDSTMAKPAENIATLDTWLDMPRLGSIEYLAEPAANTVASRLQLPHEWLSTIR